MSPLESTGEEKMKVESNKIGKRQGLPSPSTRRPTSTETKGRVIKGRKTLLKGEIYHRTI
ncbi:hypothetical protein C922_05696 [Plasmodium inui San Antonio 1]|uniref:Uncharacterized protein n=1 Tax=Plasmodium inui San Antonio 1 TaxID=1237626 RepID=W6ZX91_9APIC|nr:hypothetical protein C922_05696 [Plasmodium inui San Antonio 1]EUD63923.1 hypothetical protein C922_05696 [Plasmodium inui San Antonio 1]